jgi:glycosyltransferase involved in cell wall biosynthesis
MSMSLRAARYVWRRTPAWLRSQLAPIIDHAICTARQRRLRTQWRRGSPAGDHIAVVGFHSAVLGLGEGARLQADALAMAGFDVERIDVGCLLDGAAGECQVIPVPRNASTVISHLNPPELLRYLALTAGSAISDRRHIGYWAWELPDPPREWRACFGLVDEVWVPSRFVAQSLRRMAPASTVIRVVPHPVHLSPRAVPDRTRFGLPPDKVLVLAAMDLRSTLARKNLDGLLAIVEAAAASTDRSLAFVLKVVGTAHEPHAYAHLRRRLDRQPAIHLIEGNLAREEMARLVASIDIVLSPHRAEGFGLLLAEGMRAGKAVVGTGWSGNVDFMADGVSILLDYSLVPVVDPQRRYSRSRWAEPSVTHAVDVLLELAADADLRAGMGARASQHLSRVLGDECWVDLTGLTRPPRASLAAGFR